MSGLFILSGMDRPTAPTHTPELGTVLPVRRNGSFLSLEETLSIVEIPQMASKIGETRAKALIDDLEHESTMASAKIHRTRIHMALTVLRNIVNSSSELRTS